MRWWAHSDVAVIRYWSWVLRASDEPKERTEKLAHVSNAIRRMPAAVSELAELAYNSIAFSRLEEAYASFQPDILYERYNLFLLAGQWLSRTYNLPMLLEVNSPLADERSEHGRLCLGGTCASP